MPRVCIPEDGVDGGLAAALDGLVDDIVVHETGRVDLRHEHVVGHAPSRQSWPLWLDHAGHSMELEARLHGPAGRW